MRIIKFRCWDGSANKMADWSEVQDWIHSLPWDDMFTDDSLVLEQFTGLLDKSGVEIYEGDVVSNPHDTKPTHIIEWNESQAGFMLSGSCMLMSFQLSEFWTVIGNIHQPELLGDKT